MIKQLTIRGLDDELEARIRELAAREGLSLNQAVMRLLRKGAGIDPGGRRANVIGDALDDLAGTWTDDEARQLDAAVGELDRIDPDFWA